MTAPRVRGRCLLVAVLACACPGRPDRTPPGDTQIGDSAQELPPIAVGPPWPWSDSGVSDTGDGSDTGWVEGEAFACGSLEPVPAPTGLLDALDASFLTVHQLLPETWYQGEYAFFYPLIQDVDEDGCGEVGLLTQVYLDAERPEEGRTMAFFALPGTLRGDWRTEETAYLYVVQDRPDEHLDEIAGGDVDGDGARDWILVNPGDYVLDLPGEVYWVAGTTTGAYTASELPILAKDTTSGDPGFGRSISTGDGNGDGYSDTFVVGGESHGYLFNGPVMETRTTADADAVIEDIVFPTTTMDGDLNGDGCDDIIFNGRRSDTGHFAGVLLGPVAGTVSMFDADSWIETDCMGVGVDTLAADGDTNADGYDDLLVASYYNCNEILLFAGGASLGDLSPETALAHFLPAGYFSGASLSLSQDMDGDGFDDPVVGDHAVDRYQYPHDIRPEETQEAYVNFGPVSGTVDLGASDVTFSRKGGYGGIGYSLLASGDTDGDGFDDLLFTPGPAMLFRGGFR